MRPARFSGSPPKYMSPSRSRISLSPLAVNGVRLLFTDMVPGMEGWKQSELTALGASQVRLPVNEPNERSPEGALRDSWYLAR